VQIEARELVAPKRAAIPGLPDAACSEEAHAPDVFICEDLQALETSASAQDRLVAAMDLVLSCGGRAIITGNRLPGEMLLSQKLVSRLHGGTCATLRAPEVAGRRMLLEHFSRRANLLLSPDAVTFLAERLAVSPRELAAAVAQLAALSKAERQGLVSLDLARRFIADDVPAPAPTIAEIARAVARQFDVPLRDIQSESRMRRLLLPRQCAMYLARELTEDSLADIGRFFGRSNHSTVAHACNRIRLSLPEEPSLRRQLWAIRQVLRQV
jgi:chromosomal replication initiator protein